MSQNPVVSIVDDAGAPVTFGAAAAAAASAATTATDGSTTATAQVGYNSGGPGGGNLDRARTLQGKGLASNTLSGNISLGQPLVLLNAGSVPVAGQQITLLGGTAESGYVLKVIGQTVTLTANLANNHLSGTTVEWDTFATAGPGAAGFLPIGVHVVAGAVYDPAAGLYYVPQGTKGVTYTTSSGSTATPIAGGVAGDTVIKGTPGRLCRVVVTATGANPMVIWDNASGHTGTIIGALPANPAVGTSFDFQMPAALGITVQGSATNPGVTISFL